MAENKKPAIEEDDFYRVGDLLNTEDVIWLTDENLNHAQAGFLKHVRTIVVPPGEASKSQATADHVIGQLLEMQADKSTVLAALGGGVVSDLGGYVASVYKRGMRLALLPSSILGMTDAALGGKNGINTGGLKNVVGTTYRPDIILYDMNLLSSLPKHEWVNGFAEIIKHACIKDAAMFAALSQHDLSDYMTDDFEMIYELVNRNVALKTAVTEADEFETGERYKLNFGHSFGHAIESLYGTPHGNAVGIGMMIAAELSVKFGHAAGDILMPIAQLLKRYELPVKKELDFDGIRALMMNDKKRKGEHINFVFLTRIGEAVVQKVSVEELINAARDAG